MEDYEQPRQNLLNKVRDFYKKKYKNLLFITIGLLVLAIVQIIIQTSVTGDFIHKDITLKGGLSITVTLNEQTDINSLQDVLSSEFPRAGTQVALIVYASDVEEENLVSSLKDYLGPKGQDYSVEIMGSSLGKSFFKETIIALLIAFLLMGIVVFITFRTIVPSSAVILSAFSDIVVTLAIINLMGIRLSTAGIAAFLMLIGYSVDTDILLSTRVLKRKEGTVFERVMSSMKTGMTMTLTTMIAVTVALIISPSPVINQIMTILLIGLFVDVLNTWIQNAGILRLYMEKKAKSQQTYS